ncbi:hypothetical protein B0A49_10380 [Cryomyces minteri]|uniref:Ubiquinone biosynthesis O-methyltransferase, mitochondrial n=1 Tax=Cryomyces minteri TaxID=331657 RepID=A0A4U0WMW9_9PEZI|nr:hypothetical protein B0A49_10380 [Cryomyces minteri]
MNPLRHKFISQCLQTQVYPPDASTRHRYLDVGCGGGIFAESVARLPNTESVTAIDPSPEVLAVAKQHQKRDPLLLEPGRLTYLDASIESLPHSSVPEDGFDIVSLFEVIEHIQHPSSFLSNVIPHVRPGGWLVLSTIARSPVSWFTTKLMAEEVLNIVPRGTHTWSQYINPAELEAWFMRDDGFWKPETMGVVYVPMLGWKEVSGSEKIGNYFFGVQRKG